MYEYDSLHQVVLLQNEETVLLLTLRVKRESALKPAKVLRGEISFLLLLSIVISQNPLVSQVVRYSGDACSPKTTLYAAEIPIPFHTLNNNPTPALQP
jgi:hypothetical protein